MWPGSTPKFLATFWRRAALSGAATKGGANLRFYVEVGAQETGKTPGGPIFIEANRRLRQALEGKGYDVRYVEVSGARHDPIHWRFQLADGILYLAGEGVR